MELQVCESSTKGRPALKFKRSERRPDAAKIALYHQRRMSVASSARSSMVGARGRACYLSNHSAILECITRLPEVSACYKLLKRP